jgi:N-methylhydantoinase A
VDTIIHGQTLVINTIVTRTGAKVGLIATRGFRDVLEQQRSNRRDMYSFRYRKPESLVPRYLRLEINERVASDGTVLTPLPSEEIGKAVDGLTKEGVEAIAISLMNSYATCRGWDYQGPLFRGTRVLSVLLTKIESRCDDQ